MRIVLGGGRKLIFSLFFIRSQNPTRAFDQRLPAIHRPLAWRGMPHDLPKWQTVYGYFRQWTKTGVWERINDALRRMVRVAEGRKPEPTAGRDYISYLTVNQLVMLISPETESHFRQKNGDYTSQRLACRASLSH